MTNNIGEYIKTSSSNKTEFYIANGNTTVFIKDRLPDNINTEEVFNKIQSVVPTLFFNNIDVVYIGQFDVLIEKGTNALYSDGAIYITNDQDDAEDLVDDFIHELAHSIEEDYPMELYADQELESEFLGKRNRLANILKNNDIDISGYNFLKSEFSYALDTFFYQEIGYPLLSTFTQGLFYSPYAATSLREYFANGFENFYLRDKTHLKQLSPKLYNKIYSIHEIGEQ
ncbi:MAG TPA: hypothetical protein EYN08_00590 [Gammaproteobacteria bacterium]|nr:hypothetical protein [Gammaproteobacteria bacterium]